ncbi:MAG: putative motility protein [Alphaproteobacteria bacterium]|uniref:hypothetical protein n=1 Tax=Pacificispira sp. TaxID=2888761 RepID=UPI002ECDB357|nr:hypothetical protein [Pseudomonadota bacterium]
MADVLGVLALNQAQYQQQMSIALLKQNLDAQDQVTQLVAQAAGTAAPASGDQPLNASGPGQIVNTLA